MAVRLPALPARHVALEVSVLLSEAGAMFGVIELVKGGWAEDPDGRPVDRLAPEIGGMCAAGLLFRIAKQRGMSAQVHSEARRLLRAWINGGSDSILGESISHWNDRQPDRQAVQRELMACSSAVFTQYEPAPLD